MLTQETLNHFNTISDTWEQKGWVNDEYFNLRISGFLRSTEKKIGLTQKRHKSSLYFGIGTGKIFHQFKRYNFAGVDEASGMLGKCPEGVIQILSKVEELPFLMDNQFHLTFSRNLLKHCPEPERAIESMYRKTRRGGVCVCAESVVFQEEDKVIPNTLLQFTDPTHPSFLSIDEVVQKFEYAGFSRVEYIIFPYRSAWLSKWLAAEQGTKRTREEALDLYRSAPADFLERQQVSIKDDEIVSTVPWVMVRAFKE